MRGVGRYLDKSNSCVKINVGLQTTIKKHRRSKMDNNSLAHTKWECKYHIVFAPKYSVSDIVVYGSQLLLLQ